MHHWTPRSSGCIRSRLERLQKYNVQVEWETGEITYGPLSIIAADDPVTWVAYAKENDLLAVVRWCRFRNLAKKDKVFARAIKQSKISDTIPTKNG